MTEFVTQIAELEAAYGAPSPAALAKVADRLTPLYKDWIRAARFCVISTAGPGGTDGSPRGDDGPVVAVAGDRTLLLPDWKGNNRMDTLRNIVADGRVSLMFFVPGNTNVVRVNGRAQVTLDDGMRARFETGQRVPRSVIVIEVAEVYAQCARAILRAGLWQPSPAPDLPSMGDLLAEATVGREGGAEYDAAWMDRARSSMW